MSDELINLVEFAKGHDDPLVSGLIEVFATSSDVLQVLPFKNVTQGVNRFDRETSIPAVKLRGLNEEPEISHGSEESFQDIVNPISGLLEFDRMKLKRFGERKRMTYMKGQMKSANALFTDLIISGSNRLDPREWDGLQVRCVADRTGDVSGTKHDSRLIANSTASGGAPLSLGMLDIFVNHIAEPTHLLMPHKMKARFETAARSSTLSNNRVTEDMDSNLGRRVLRFGDLPLLFGYPIGKNGEFLPFNEVAYGGGAAVTSSIYGVSIREDGVCGIQTDVPELMPVETDRGVYKRHLFEWDSGLTVEDEYAIARLSSIADAPIAA